MNASTLADLPGLKPDSELPVTLTVRLTREDREQISHVARELGVAPSRLARAVLRKVLIETADVERRDHQLVSAEA